MNFMQYLLQIKYLKCFIINVEYSFLGHIIELVLGEQQFSLKNKATRGAIQITIFFR